MVAVGFGTGDLSASSQLWFWVSPKDETSAIMDSAQHWSLHDSA